MTQRGLFGITTQGFHEMVCPAGKQILTGGYNAFGEESGDVEDVDFKGAYFNYERRSYNVQMTNRSGSDRSFKMFIACM